MRFLNEKNEGPQKVASRSASQVKSARRVGQVAEGAQNAKLPKLTLCRVPVLVELLAAIADEEVIQACEKQ